VILVATTAESTFCLRWGAAELYPSIHIVHKGQGSVRALPSMKW